MSHITGLEDWDYEPEIPGKSQRPDYRLRYAAAEFFLEVKEFHQPKQPLPQGGAYDPYGAIREKIDAAREKFRNFKEHCCSLVLFNVDAWLVHLDDFWIMVGSMVGDLGFSFPVDMETGSAVGEPTWAFLKRGKMIDHKHLRPQNTTISALTALTPLAVGQKRFEIELQRKEGELGRALELEEFMRFAESLRARGLNTEETVTRVVVYENPYARIPLPRDIFVGDYDERYCPEKDSIVRVFAGTEVESLRTRPLGELDMPDSSSSSERGYWNKFTPPGQAKKYGCYTYTFQGRPHYYYQDEQGLIIVRRPVIEIHGSVDISH